MWERKKKGRERERRDEQDVGLCLGFRKRCWSSWEANGGICRGYPLSEDVCGAVEGERRLRVVEVQDLSERSERSDAREAGRKR